MNIAADWLSDFIELKGSPEAVAEVLTQTGLEVEGITTWESVKGSLKGLVTGKVITCDKHPNADKLSLTTVDIGQPEAVQIVCGAPNVAVGQAVVVAPVGTTLYPAEGDAFQIKRAKIRGEVSEGMICAEDEIGLGSRHDGILILDADPVPGTPAHKLFEIGQDSVFEIGLTPNRADAASHLGVSRDLRAVWKVPIKMPDVSAFRVDNQDRVIEVEVRDTTRCPRYAGLTLSGIEIKPSPTWMQNRLKSIGLVPINNVVDATNYVLHELGQPLHAFDTDKIKGNKIIVDTLPGGTVFKTLDEVDRTLADEDLMICNVEEGMCIGGVFGGIASGVTERTTSIFLESAYFNPDTIRKTSLRHGLKTDAAFRFERGVDPDITITALKRAALLIKELSGAKISSEIVDIYPVKIEPVRIGIKWQHIYRLIGVEIDQEVVREILMNLDIGIEKEETDGFVAVVPAYRVDVTREADVIEEILRIYGYNQVPLSPYLGTTFLANFPEIDKDNLIQRISQLLASSGFQEIVTNSLSGQSLTVKLKQLRESNAVRMLNYTSEELSELRQAMYVTGIPVIAHNLNRKQRNLRFFEFGKVYRKLGNEYQEQEVLALYATGNRQESSWREETRKVDFYDLANVVKKVLKQQVGTELSTSETVPDIYSYGISLSLDNKPLATIGLLEQNIISLFQVDAELFYAEVNLELLLSSTNNNIVYEEISRFPEVKRDLSLVLNKDVLFDQVLEVAKTTDRKLIKSVSIFDVYEGKNIDPDKKAYALTFILEDKQKTLTDKEIDKTMTKLIREFQSKLGAYIRK